MSVMTEEERRLWIEKQVRDECSTPSPLCYKHTNVPIPPEDITGLEAAGGLLRRKAAGVVEGRKDDAGKTDWGLVPWPAMEIVAAVLQHGAEKYGRDNWKNVTDAQRRYFNAAMRHLLAHQRGELSDADSGRPHLAHAICCLLFLLQL